VAKVNLEDRLEKARQREAQARARRLALEAKANNRKRTEENGEKFVIGATVINAMERDPDFAKQVCALLEQYVTKPYDRERVKRWLPQA
jgi:hypothetical protein